MIFREMPPAFEQVNKENPYEALSLEILREENLNPIPSEIERSKIVCQDANGNQFLMKICGDTEKLVFTDVLPLIRQQNLPFRILQLPEFRNVVSRDFQQDDIPQHLNFIFIQYYDGKRFDHNWNEISPLGYGGRGIDISMAGKVIDLLGDSSLIDVSLLSTFDLPTYNLNNWRNYNLPYLGEILIEREILNQDLIDKASSILSSTNLFKHSKIIFTNGDCYPRNLIELSDGKIVIVDWEGRQDYKTKITVNGTLQKLEDQRNAFINYLENNVAFFFIHMWGNYVFQKQLIREATKRFNLTAENLQAAILIKSLEQQIIWPDDLARRQAEIFVDTLDINFIRDLMM